MWVYVKETMTKRNEITKKISLVQHKVFSHSNYTISSFFLYIYKTIDRTVSIQCVKF